MNQFIRQAQSEKGFFQITLLGVIAVFILVGAGGVLFSRKNKTSPFGKTEVTSKETTTDKLEKELAPAPKAESKPTVSSATSNKPSKEQDYVSKTQQSRDPWKDPVPTAPVNLALPFVAADMKEGEESLSPYGVIRHSRDGGIGHGGIDFPFESGSPFYAVADGTIIKNDVEDSGGGKTVDVLIAPKELFGEGWIFKYEHIALEPGLAVGSGVGKGQKIGINAFEQRGNNHVGLEYHIKNFTIAREKICWVDRLEAVAKQQLENVFNRIKKTSTFLRSWQTANEEGYYQYKGLLDAAKYPNGPQLCYPLGTDARIPLSSGLVPTTQSAQNQKPILKNLGINMEPWDKKTNKAGDFLFENKNYVDNKIFTEFAHKIVNEFGEKLLPEIGFNVPVGTKVVSPIDGVVTDVKFYEPSQDYLISIKIDESSPWIVGFEHIYNVRIKAGDKVLAGQELAEVSPSYGKTEFGNVEINVWTGGREGIFKYCPFNFLDDSLKPTYEQKINQLARDWEEFIGKDVYKQENWVAHGCLLDRIQEQ